MADKIKGITIEIGGDTSPLNKALSDVNKESKSIQNELKSVEKLLKFDPTNTELIAQKQQLLAENVENAKKKLDLLKQAQEEVNKKVASGEIDKGSEEYRAFERQVIAAEQSLHKAESAQISFSDECKNAGKDAKSAGIDVENAGKKAKNSGEDAKKGGAGWQKFGELAQKAGKIAVAGVTAIAAGATASGKAVWDMAQQTADAGGAIDDAAKKVGTSAEEYQKWTYAAKLGGMEVSKLESLMVKQQKTFADAQDGGKAAAEAYKRLGIDISSIGNSGEAFNVVIDKLADMQDETTRNALANDIFGKSYADLAPLLAEGAAGIAAWKQECEDLGGVISGEAVEAGAQFGDSLDRLKTTFTGIKNSIIGNLLPSITLIIDGFTGIMSGQDGAKDKISSGVSGIIENIKNAAPQLTEILKTLIMTATSLIAELLPVFLTTMLDMAPEFINVAFELIGIFTSTILAPDNSTKLIDSAFEIINTLIGTLLSPSNITNIIEAAIQIIVTVANGIGSALPTLIPSVIQAILTVVETLTKPENLEMILDAVFAVVQGAADGILTAIPMIIDALPAIITNVITFLTKPENIKKILQAGIQLLGAIIQAVPEIALSLIQALPQIGRAIKNGLGNLWSIAKDIGGDLIRGLWNGISNAGEWLREKISGFFGGVVDSIKDFFGIHSSSTLFRDMIGKNLVKGIEVGVDFETPNLEENLNRNLKMATNGLKATVEAEETQVKLSAVGAGGTSLGGIHLHIGTFNNNSDRDINGLVEEVLEVAEDYISRRREVFA